MRTPHLLCPLCIAAVLAVLLGAGSLARAQSGGEFDLSWSTMDAGGATWSSGGDYVLGGTLGQPDASGAMTGGIYALRGGFWRPPCHPQVVPASIACSGDHATLTWTADPANLGYDIHRGATPYFAPDPGTRQATVTAGPWMDLQAGTCGDVAANYTYIVRSTCIGGHQDGMRKGEFDFPLAAGTP